MASLPVFAPSPRFRGALAALADARSFETIAEASDIRELSRREKDGPPPQLVLLAPPKALADPPAIIQQIRRWAPDAKVVFVATSLDTRMMSACFAAGASGFLLETISAEGLRHSLRLVIAGERLFPSELASLLSLRHIAKAEPNNAIARQLGVTKGEVGVHITKILRSLRIANRTQAAPWAVAHGSPGRKAGR